MTHLGFTSCKVDPDIWMQEEINDDGSAYWGYILLYMDDTLFISMNSGNVLNNEIGNYFLIKPGSIGYTNIYLSNKVS